MLLTIIACAVGCFIGVIILIYKYAEKKRCRWYVWTAALLSWYLPFATVFLLPFDLSSTLYRSCGDGAECDMPSGYLNSEQTLMLWRVLYWTMYILTWLVLPLMMTYVDSGAFTLRTRLREAVIYNLRYNSIMICVGLVGIGYLTIVKHYFGRDLLAFLMAAANFWGLILVVMFMGCGLVIIPRQLWHLGDTQYKLKSLSSKILQVKDRLEDAQFDLDDALREAKLLSARISPTHLLYPYMEIIMNEIPSTRVSSTSRLNDNRDADDHSVEVSEAQLANLHSTMQRVVRRERKYRWKLTKVLHEAIFYLDLAESKNNPDQMLVLSLHPYSQWTDVQRKAGWWWYIHLRPMIYRSLGLLAGLVSACILWSEVMFKVRSPPLSIIQNMIYSLGLSYYAIEIMSFIILSYMSLCAYSSVMKMKLFNFYSLAWNHHTNERSLLFCGAYLCRLMAPLCYNFLIMVGPSIDSVFEEFMQITYKFPIFGESANRWMPALILLPSTLTFFNAHTRIMNLFGSDSNSHGSRADNDHDDDEDYGDTETGRNNGGGEGWELVNKARRLAQNKGANWTRHLGSIGIYLLVDEDQVNSSPSPDDGEYDTFRGRPQLVGGPNVWASNAGSTDGLNNINNTIISVENDNTNSNSSHAHGPSGIAARLGRRLDNSRTSTSTPLLSNLQNNGGSAQSSGSLGRSEQTDKNFLFNPWKQ